MEVQEIKTLATDVAPKRYKCDGNFIKVETVPSGNPLYIKTSENETALLVAGRSEKFEKPFNWIEITGFVAGELLTLQTGLGWMLDSIPSEIAGTVEITGPITSGVGNALLRFIQHNSIENMIQTGAVVESNLRAASDIRIQSTPWVSPRAKVRGSGLPTTKAQMRSPT